MADISAADHPIGTVVVHPDDDRMSPTARRRIAVDASDYCGPYEGCRWQRLTGVGIGDGGCDPLHSRDVAGWPVQPLAEVAVVLGHPSTDPLVQELLGALQKSWNDADSLRASREAWAIEAMGLDLELAGRPTTDAYEKACEALELRRVALVEALGLPAATSFYDAVAQAAQLASERRVYADSPGDRLWHDADRTWWRRAEDGRLVRADEPDLVQDLRLEAADALAALADLERQRDTWWNQRPTERATLSQMLRDMAMRATHLRRVGKDGIAARADAERFRDELIEARAEVESFYSATRRLASMFWLDPEAHQTLDVLGSIAEQLAAWRADAAQVPEGWQSLVRKGWSVGASRPAIPADAEKQLNYLLVRACNAEPLEFQPLAEARKLLAAWSVPASGSGIKPSWFGRTCSGCGSHVAAREPEGVGDVLCTQCHPDDLPLTIGSDTTTDGPKRQWTDSTGIVWQEAQPGFVHVVSPVTGQPHMFGEPVTLEKVEAKFGPLTAMPTPDTDTTEVPGE